MVHFLYWVFLLIAGWPQDAQQNVGTKVVWRYGAGDTAGGEMTVYTMGDRRRTEYRNTALHRDSIKEPLHPADPPANVVIQRCDLGRSLELNTHTQEYTSKTYPASSDEPKKRDASEQYWEMSSLPIVRVETTNVDTGEREEIFGQVARHVTITNKATRLLDTGNAPPSVWASDGWYIDYERRISCEPPEEFKTHDYAYFEAGGQRVFTQRVEKAMVGKREEGLLVKGQNNLSTSITRTDGKETTTLSNATYVTEFYKGSLNPALFEIPADFKAVDKIGWAPIN
ncbi:MAG: hypothetical protein WCC21_20670 [Candidatus Acidiferrales bacterium]